MSHTHLRTVIVEDHEITRLGLRMMLEDISEIEVVGEAADGLAAIEMCIDLKPELVLMDIGLPGLDGIETTKAIKAAIQTRVVLLTSHAREEDVSAGLVAGADAYCLKNISLLQLALAVRAVRDGAIWLDPGIARQFIGLINQSAPTSLTSPASPASLTGNIQLKPDTVADSTPNNRVSLSAREHEVLALLVEGLSNQEVGNRLHISTETVKTHMRRIMEKLGVSDRTQAAVKAVKEGLINGREKQR